MWKIVASLKLVILGVKVQACCYQLYLKLIPLKSIFQSVLKILIVELCLFCWIFQKTVSNFYVQKTSHTKKNLSIHFATKHVSALTSFRSLTCILYTALAQLDICQTISAKPINNSFFSISWMQVQKSYVKKSIQLL